MNKRELLMGLRATQTPEMKRCTAYHETGHAVAQWMCGYGSDIHSIDIRGALEHKGVVKSKRTTLDGYDCSDPYTYGVAKLRGKHDMINYLAGYAVQHLVYPSGCGHWLDEQLDMEGEEWFKDDPNDGHDMARALRTAKKLRGDNGNAWRFLRQMASWTDEALSHPRIWKAVEALAECLVIRNRMSGKAACRTMENAWGTKTMIPWWDMGRTWQRRFSVSH